MTEGDGARRGSDSARAWAAHIAAAFGRAVNLHRTRLGLSAVQLSNRCREIGYPITRGTIAKIETNSRNAKMDVAEVLTLAAALEIAPADLMFPGYPAESQSVTPRATMRSEKARNWFIGSSEYNEFERLHTPRITQSKAMMQAIKDLDHAVESFENRHNIRYDSGEYWFADFDGQQVDGEVSGVFRMNLDQEYKLIEELYEQAEEAGGSVILPDWFETYNAVPF